jgi:glutamate carboxypeptidase
VLDIKKRGLDVSPEELRKVLLAGTGSKKNKKKATLILTRVGDERVAIEVEGGFRRPPMERTPAGRRLWELARSCARDLGLDLDEAAVGGGSDGNFTSRLAPTVDGLGAVGDGAHADHEHVVIARMPERAALLAMLMMTPHQGAS